MYNIITFLLGYIQLQYKIIIFLLTVVLGKFPLKKNTKQPINKPYRKFQVDPMPVIKILETLDYKKLIQERFLKDGKVIRPVKRRKGKDIPHDISCPRGNAPHEYIYDNTGGKGQFKCKVCAFLFNRKTKYLKTIAFHCPFCGRTLELKKSASILISTNALILNARSI